MEKLIWVDDYKTIKKSVVLIEEKLKEVENNGIKIDEECIMVINEHCHRLISERNLRHYLCITDLKNFTKEN